MYPITFPMIAPKMTRTQYLTVASTATASIPSSHDRGRVTPLPIEENIQKIAICYSKFNYGKFTVTTCVYLLAEVFIKAMNVSAANLEFINYEFIGFFSCTNRSFSPLELCNH